MSIRKRNEFLDSDESEDEVDNGYESEQEAGRGAIARHSNKRRKVETESEASFDGIDEEEPATSGKQTSDDRFNFDKIGSAEDLEEDDDEDEPKTARSDHDRIKSTKPSKSKAEKELEAAEKAARKSGVVYISRVPPFMKPQTLKHFLEPHARKGLGRIFLTPEDHAAHTRRVKNGGNKKKSFTDGWVEFKSKKEAKIAAETLNGNIIGGKTGNFYHDDLWNMKYLKGFKWNHLTEQIANENAERAARTQQEIRKTRKENKAFVEDIERAKMLEGMESKKKAKMDKNSSTNGDMSNQHKREFKQRQPRTNGGKDSTKTAPAQAGGFMKLVF